MSDNTKKTSKAAKTAPARKPASTSRGADIADDKPVRAIKPDIHQYITVRNGFRGVLIHKSRNTGERFVWSEFGDEQEIQLLELRNAKSSNKKMFENNYFMFDEEFDWVIDYLGVRNFYPVGSSVEDLDAIFDKTPSQAKKIISQMSKGQKRSLSYRARQLIEDGDIDSRRMISALEEGLGVELIEG